MVKAAQFLRAGVTKAQKQKPADKDIVNAIQNEMLTSQQEVLSASGMQMANKLNEELALHDEAIKLVLTGLTLAAGAIAYQQDKTHSQLEGLTKEMASHACTFLRPNMDKQNYKSLYREQKIMHQFFDLSFNRNNQLITHYLGIDKQSVDDGSLFYSVLPFYRSDELLELHVESDSQLDLERAAINLFFSSALDTAFDEIKQRFSQHSTVIEFFSSIGEQSNYLNAYRVPRFIMMSLANLLWNLQNPFDPDTGLELDTDTSIELCRAANAYLGEVLSIKKIDKLEGNLVSLVSKVQEHVIGLWQAYNDSRLHDFKLKDLNNNLRSGLRIMIKSVFKLVYKEINAETGYEQPNEKASADIMYKLYYLSQLLDNDPSLMKVFAPYANKVADMPFINKLPCTVMDALAIFSRLRFDERQVFFKSLGSHIQREEFSRTLISFHDKYIVPIRRLKPKIIDRNEAGRLASKRLLPLLALLVEEQRFSLDPAKLIAWSAQFKPNFTAASQVKAINEMAKTNQGYYTWTVATLDLTNTISNPFSQLICQQYRLLCLTNLFDRVAVLAQNNAEFWQFQSFQRFILGFIEKVKAELNHLSVDINSFDSTLTDERGLSNHKQVILSRMLHGMSQAQARFNTSSDNFVRIVGAANFSKQQALLLEIKIEAIAREYKTLFNEPAGLDDIILRMALANQDNESIKLESVTPSISIEANAIQGACAYSALRQLLQGCFDGMSYYSKSGYKGQLMQQLIKQVDAQNSFTDTQVREILTKLFRICASYRETIFFQADYAKTRTAQALIKLIKSPAIYQQLPLGALLFSDNHKELSSVSDNAIFEQLSAMRTINHWERGVSEIALMVI